MMVHIEQYCRELEQVAARHGMAAEGRRIALCAFAGCVAGLAKQVVGSGIDEREWYERQLASPALSEVKHRISPGIVPLRWYVVFRAFASGRFRLWRMLVKMRDLVRRSPE